METQQQQEEVMNTSQNPEMMESEIIGEASQENVEKVSSEGLWQILQSLASQHQPEPLVLHEDCHPYAVDYFDSLDRENFDNAREAEKLLLELEDNMKLRAYQQHITDFTIRPEDFPKYESNQAEPEQEEEIPVPHEGGFTRYLKEHAVYEEKATADPLERIYNLLENLQVNMVLLVQNQSSAADVAAMRRENEAYKSDANMKLMRAYGVDAMIRIYQAVSERLFRLHHPAGEPHPTDEGEEKALLWVQKRMAPQFKKLGIRLQTSEIGTEFNGDTMVVYGDNGEDVDESETMFPASAEHPDDTIKESVSPAFIWTIPSLNNMSREWCMEPEKVCIYVD
jgi:hypothetical protein